MGKVEKFEDLIAWQKARSLVADIYKATTSEMWRADPSFRRQIRSAALSVMSNVAESFERNRANEFHQFLSVSKGSCAELRSQLYAASDIGYLNRDVCSRLLQRAEEVGQIVGGLRAAVARQRQR